MSEEIKIEGPTVNLNSRISRLKFAIWQLLEDPQSSTTALCVSIFSLAMTVFSILILCIDSLPQLDKLMKAFDSCHDSAKANRLVKGVEVSGFNFRFKYNSLSFNLTTLGVRKSQG